MALFIEIVEGAQTGQRFRIASGFRMGRTTGEILINDAKVSSLHAQIEKDNRGYLVLVDRDSSNGLRINGQKVKRIAMMPGVTFQIGKTLLKVVQLFGEEAVVEEEKTPSGWKEILKTQVPKLSSSNKSGVSQIQALSPTLQLDFIEGIQAETSLVLGYGPRKLGADVLDIELQEPKSPAVAFEIHPDPQGIRFFTKHPEEVRLNDQAVSSDMLKDGDLVRVGDSLIKIKLLK